MARCEEVFGPVTTVEQYETVEDTLRLVNDSAAYGLQAGVFTSSIERAMLAHRELHVGGVIVNDQSAFRADQMPYGGAKESGYGREGLRFAMEEMTEPRLMVLSNIPLWHAPPSTVRFPCTPAQAGSSSAAVARPEPATRDVGCRPKTNAGPASREGIAHEHRRG